MNLTEDDYHAYPAWSHSVVYKYAKDGFPAIATLHDKTEPTPSMEFGSLFDSMITRGSVTKEEYVIFEDNIPPAEKKCLDTLSHITKEKNLVEVSKAEIMRAKAESMYYPNWGFDATFKHLNDYHRYFETIQSGKKVCSRKDWDDAVEMYRNFRSDKFLKELFGTKNHDGIEYLYQTQYLVDWTSEDGETVKIKIMPDLIKVDHNAKTIQPVDLKTSSVQAYRFKENFIQFRYDLQATMYTYALDQVKSKDPDYWDYEILPYIFTDISRSDKVPVSYVYDQFAESQKDGLSYTYNGREVKYKGWQQLMNEILRYERIGAVVPDGIKTEAVNNLIDIMNR